MTKLVVEDKRWKKDDEECKTELIIEDDGFRFLDEHSCIIQYVRQENKLYIRKNLQYSRDSGSHDVYVLKD